MGLEPETFVVGHGCSQVSHWEDRLKPGRSSPRPALARAAEGPFDLDLGRSGKCLAEPKQLRFRDDEPQLLVHRVAGSNYRINYRLSPLGHIQLNSPTVLGVVPPDAIATSDEDLDQLADGLLAHSELSRKTWSPLAGASVGREGPEEDGRSVAW
jgi:hypothetical protein